MQNVWRHAAATCDGTTWELYLDGVVDGTLNVGVVANAATTMPSRTGGGFTTTGVADGFFASVIDKVRV
jgi:Concanavalin A-like lectin/glucanases superfamily